jgi:hypothetical protein
MVNAQDSGFSLTDSWARWDRITSSWKTSQLSLLEGWDVFSATWPDEGWIARWGCVPVCAFGGTHPRRRLFIVAYADRLNGRPGFRDSVARAFGPLQTIDGFESARAREKARLADPSALYGGAHGVPYRLERNRAIGNSVHPAVAQWIAERIQAAEGHP